MVTPPTLNKQEDSVGFSTGIYTVSGWLITHLSPKFTFELSHTGSHPSFPGANLVPVSTMGKTNAHSFPPTFYQDCMLSPDPDFMAV